MGAFACPEAGGPACSISIPIPNRVAAIPCWQLRPDIIGRANQTALGQCPAKEEELTETDGMDGALDPSRVIGQSNATEVMRFHHAIGSHTRQEWLLASMKLTILSELVFERKQVGMESIEAFDHLAVRALFEDSAASRKQTRTVLRRPSYFAPQKQGGFIPRNSKRCRN